MADLVDVLILGSSGHAKVIINIFEERGEHRIVGLIDDHRPVGSETLGYSVLGDFNSIQDLLTKRPECHVFVAVGDNTARKVLVTKLQCISSSVNFASAVHPSAIIARSVKLGVGVAVMAGVVVNGPANIADFCILNTRSCIDHDCTLDEFASLAPGVSLGGNVHIGHCSAVGIGAVVKHGVTIADHSVIGAGSVVLKDCDSRGVYFGVPARFVRHRDERERYL
jgi:sugar O-acyltransferase (sialic acid O-acetyltransferase NeuD family)